MLAYKVHLLINVEEHVLRPGGIKLSLFSSLGYSVKAPEASLGALYEI